MKALTVKTETVTLVGKANRIGSALCINCMQLVVKYFSLEDVLFLGRRLRLESSFVGVNTVRLSRQARYV
jgi:hypothetical protein